MRTARNMRRPRPRHVRQAVAAPDWMCGSVHRTAKNSAISGKPTVCAPARRLAASPRPRHFDKSAIPISLTRPWSHIRRHKWDCGRMEDDAYTEKVPSQGMRMGLWLDKGRLKQRQQPTATVRQSDVPLGGHSVMPYSEAMTRHRSSAALSTSSLTMVTSNSFSAESST